MKNIEQYNENGQAHGYCEWHWTNGSLSCKCFYDNGKRVGYEEHYYSWVNELDYKTYYI